MASKSGGTVPPRRTEPQQPPPDDLTVISGIGKARQEWLRNTFQVKTLHDLAKLSPDEIEVRLKAEGQIVSLPKIEAWLNEARRLAQARTGGANREHGWKPIAQFVVEFQEHRDATDAPSYQTHVHHMEADRSATWPGFEQTLLCGWMVQQLGDVAGELTTPPEATADAPEILATVSQRFQQLLTEVQATVQSTAPGQPASSERFQRLLQKVQSAEGNVPTLPPSAPLQVVTPAESSERFQRLLVKVQSKVPAEIKSNKGVRPSLAKAESVALAPAATQTLIPTASDERYQRLLAKVQAAERH